VHLAIWCTRWAFRFSYSVASRSEFLTRLNTRPHVPCQRFDAALATLRMTRGRCGSLVHIRMNFAFTTLAGLAGAQEKRHHETHHSDSLVDSLRSADCFGAGVGQGYLEKSPRHRVGPVKHDGRSVETFVVYPESKGKTPVVLIIHEILV